MDKVLAAASRWVPAVGTALVSLYVSQVLRALPGVIAELYGTMPTLDLVVCTVLLMAWVTAGLRAVTKYATPLTQPLKRLFRRLTDWLR